MTEHRALCGWLLKQDAQALWKGWKKRWFQQLNDFQLYYFTSCTTDISQSKGYIDLKQVVNVKVDSVNKSENKYIFEVITPERTYVLQANSEDECGYWVAGINSILANLSQPMSGLIAKAEHYEQQQQKVQQDNQRGAAQRARPQSMWLGSAQNAQMQMQQEEKTINRSASMQNITYIDYDPNGTASPSSSASTTPTTAPTTPQKPTGGSQKYTADTMMGGMEQDKEREKMEQRKLASMRDIHMLIVREKDAEIARLNEEVARINGLCEQANEANKNAKVQIQKEAAAREAAIADMQRKIGELERTHEAHRAELERALREKDSELLRTREGLSNTQAEMERLREELARTRQEMTEKLSVLEGETQKKDNIITQLNSNIGALNAQLASKDILLENAKRVVPSPQTQVDNAYLVTQLEKERGTRQALQEQIAFLGQEVYKRDMEAKLLKEINEEQKRKLLERSARAGGDTNLAHLPPYTHQSGIFPPIKATDTPDSPGVNLDKNEMVKFLTMQNEDLRQKYFLSVGRSLKLQMSMSGKFSNVNITDLYDGASRDNVKVEDWPNWISAQIAASLQTT